MEKNFFEWKKLIEKYECLVFPVDEMGEIFELDVQEKSIYLSKKCAELLFEKNGIRERISQEEFEKHLSAEGCHAFRQAIQRLLDGKVERVGTHAAVNGRSGQLSTVIYLFRIAGYDNILGHISVDYEPMREYERHLEETIKQLQHVQMVNELTLEGASDYIYQLDLVKNECTFSKNALEVLPLDSATFSDAMNRVLSFIIPEDRPVFLNSFTPFLTGQSTKHEADYRVLTKQGEIMWVSCHGKGVHDENGRPVMIAGSLLDITQQKKDQEKIDKMLYFDELTGLKNRRCFEKELGERLEEKDAAGSFLYMNIRKFKLYNELFGHSFGNKVLKEFAYMLNLYFVDSYGIYRISGDEFCVHLHESDRMQIMAKLIPFQSTLKKTRTIDERSVYINTYTAVVIYPEHGDSVDDLINNAHQCLYRMARAEKDEISFFAGKVGDAVSQQFWIENEIRKDIENGFRNFRVVYQPIVHSAAEGNRWTGAEALLRYTNPSLPDLDQMEMIRTLEYSGLIVPVGRWVLGRAVHECAQWNKAGNRRIVHVNVAAQQVSDAGLVDYVKHMCEQEGLSTSNLVMELTETSLLNNFEVATSFCNELLKMHIGVALDDFGTGYSSFNYLRNLPITQIKIDRGYVHDLGNNQYNQTFISFMQKLSEELKLELCVEGVETEHEYKLLKEMNVSCMQGYYFERPMESDVIRREFHGAMSV